MRGATDVLAVGILLAGVAGLPVAGVAELPDAGAADSTSWCVGDFGFVAEAPEGWSVRSEDTGLGLALSMEPAQEGSAPERAIGVLVPRRPSEGAAIDEVLGGWLALVSGFSRPIETRPLEIANPVLPTRAARVSSPQGELFLAVAGGEDGVFFHVTMACVGDAASEADLDALRRVVRSLRAAAGSCPARPRSTPAAAAR